MSRTLRTGFVAGMIGAVILIVVMYLMRVAGLGGAPGFVGIYRAMFGPRPLVEHILGAAGFALAGGIWGLVFAALMSSPSVLKGMAFGLAPSLFLWLVIAPAMGNPIFNGFTLQGILMPLIFNVLIWGSFVGWYCSSSKWWTQNQASV